MISEKKAFEDNVLKEWKGSIFTIVDKRIKFYSQNTYLLPPKPKSSFRHLKQGIQEFHRKYVLVPADKAANNVVVVCRLHYVNTLKQELDGTRAYLETDTDEMSVVNVFPTSIFWSGNLVLIVPFPDICLLVPFFPFKRFTC